MNSFQDLSPDGQSKALRSKNTDVPVPQDHSLETSTEMRSLLALQTARDLIDWFSENGMPVGARKAFADLSTSITVASDAAFLQKIKSEHWQEPKFFQSALSEFRMLVHTANDLNSIATFAEWAQFHDLTPSPPFSNKMLSSIQSALPELAHQINTSSRMGALCYFLGSSENLAELSLSDYHLVSEVFDAYERDSCIPSKLVGQLQEVTNLSYDAWTGAVKSGDFGRMAPFLEQTVDLYRQKAGYLGKHNAYDMLLDQHESECTQSVLDPLFEELKTELLELKSAIDSADKAPLSKDHITLFDDRGTNAESSAQRREERLDAVRDAVSSLGVEPERSSVATTAHAACHSPGGRYFTTIGVGQNEDLITSILSGMHEGGHALYTLGSSEAIYRSPLGDTAGPVSTGMDEAMARIQETIVGQSKAFWQHRLPELQKSFPELAEVSADELYKLVNQVNDTAVRLQSDEVTYNLHIILRYELEKSILSGEIEISDLPQEWNRRSTELLGVTPKDDTEGLLQDCHWYCGSIGYFPSYALGNIYAAQIYETAAELIPELEEEIAAGNERVLTDWLQENIAQKKGIQAAGHTIETLTGEAPNTHAYMKYLWNKYGDIYSLEIPDRYRDESVS